MCACVCVCVCVCVQHYMVEQSAYQSMALASSGVGFQWSRWNSETERRQVILQAVQAVISVNELDSIDQVCTWGEVLGL